MSECFVCKRQRRMREHGLAFRAKPVCVTCAPNAFLRFHMSNNDVSETEALALREGGARGGAFLDSIGVGAFFENVTPEQWDEFLAHILCGYAEKIRELTSEHPPF